MKKLLSLVQRKKEPETLSLDLSKGDNCIDPNSNGKTPRRQSLFDGQPKSQPTTPRKAEKETTTSKDLSQNEQIQKKNRRNTIQLLLSPFKQQQQQQKETFQEKTQKPMKIMVFGAPKCGRTTLIHNVFLNYSINFVYLIIHKINVKYEKKGRPYMEIYYKETSKKTFIKSGVPENSQFIYTFGKDEIPKEKITINSK